MEKYIQKECAQHGQSTFVLQNYGKYRYYRCRQCTSQRRMDRHRQIKEILVQEHGGRCQVCGYDKSAAVLQFHHLDRQQKVFRISRKGVSLDKARVEALKCLLVCANCHAEIENGIIVLDGTKKDSS